jgi:hypothetical protein
MLGLLLFVTHRVNPRLIVGLKRRKTAEEAPDFCQKGAAVAIKRNRMVTMKARWIVTAVVFCLQA